jgi:hypothetical protein
MAKGETMKKTQLSPLGKYELDRDKLKKYIIDNADHLSRIASVSICSGKCKVAFEVHTDTHIDGTEDWYPELSAGIRIDDVSILDEK